MKRQLVFFLLAIFIGTFCSLDASIIKKPPKKSTESGYASLVCTEEDQQCIYEIISTMGESGKLTLFRMRNHLRELGSRINHVHPLKFLATIYKNPHLKYCMQSVWTDYFKKSNFLDGLTPSLTREADAGRLIGYLPEFAAEIQVPEESLSPYFHSKEWESMVYFLTYGN